MTIYKFHVVRAGDNDLLFTAAFPTNDLGDAIERFKNHPEYIEGDNIIHLIEKVNTVVADLNAPPQRRKTLGEVVN